MQTRAKCASCNPHGTHEHARKHKNAPRLRLENKHQQTNGQKGEVMGEDSTVPTLQSGKTRWLRKRLPGTRAQHSTFTELWAPASSSACNLLWAELMSLHGICPQLQAHLPTSRNQAAEFLLDRYSSTEASLLSPIWPRL